MWSRFQHLIDLNDYSVKEWNEIISLAQNIMHHPDRYKSSLNGKIMATLFYEPSTRTQMSFQSAMLRLGGGIIGFDNPASSSVSKGESIKDTTKVVSSYSDILVIRHPKEGSAKAAALTADCPIINAGDGGHLHPTQTLTDLLTLKEEKGELSNLTIGICGDLLNGRTVHSLLKALSHYENNRFVLISTKELRLPSYVKNVLRANGCTYEEVDTLEEAMPHIDVLYMTRIQRERFASDEHYFKQKDVYILDMPKLQDAKDDLVILHPLPRVDEIANEVDQDPRALYFKQALYGVYIRMALIFTMLDQKSKSNGLLCGKERAGIACTNPNCITHTEPYLPKYFRGDDILECEYCDKKIKTI